MMITTAVRKSIQQLSDPPIRRLIFMGVLFAVGVFAALFVGMLALVQWVPASGIEWLDPYMGWIAGLSGVFLFAVVAYVLFPAIVTAFFGIFLEDIVVAVEEKHYPHNAGPRRSSLLEGIWLGLRMSLVVVIANLIALPVYLLLLFTGFGSFIVFILLNAWLLGREYFELVAVMHFPPDKAEQVRKRYRDKAFIGGVVIAGLFAVPFLNLLAPILGAAIMTHMFHGAVPDRATASAS